MPTSPIAPAHKRARSVDIGKATQQPGPPAKLPKSRSVENFLSTLRARFPGSTDNLVEEVDYGGSEGQSPGSPVQGESVSGTSSPTAQPSRTPGAARMTQNELKSHPTKGGILVSTRSGCVAETRPPQRNLRWLSAETAQLPQVGPTCLWTRCSRWRYHTSAPRRENLPGYGNWAWVNRPAILHGFGTSAKKRLPMRLAELHCLARCRPWCSATGAFGLPDRVRSTGHMPTDVHWHGSQWLPDFARSPRKWAQWVFLLEEVWKKMSPCKIDRC